MAKSRKNQFYNRNVDSFKSLISATTNLANGRADSVATIAIVGLVLSFITFVVVGGCIAITYTMRQSPNQGLNQTNSLSLEQSKQTKTL